MNFEKEVKFLQLQVSDILRKIKAKSTSWGQLLGDIRNQKDLMRYFGLKQDLLKSGKNIKTINGSSLLGYGDLQVTSSLGFTPENVANKATDFTTINDTLYPSVEAVKDYVDANSNSFIEKSSNLNITVTGTSVETLLYTKNLGIINNTNLLTIKDLLVTQDYTPSITNLRGNSTLRLRISDSPTLPTDVNSIIATLSIPSNKNTFDAFAKMERTFTFMPFLDSEAQYTIICPPPNMSYNTDIINSFGYKWNMLGQLANNKYLFITAELPFATNNCTLRSLIIQKL